jgi:hypothetical protein
MKSSTDSLHQSHHHTFRPIPDVELLAQQVVTLTRRLEEAERTSNEAQRRVHQLQVSLDAKDKECIGVKR